ncbi:MAG: hypothetical protein ACYCYE_03960 [Clostridia bacterium]
MVKGYKLPEDMLSGHGLSCRQNKNKMGKVPPYMLWIPIPLAVITALIFFVPDVGYGTKLIYATSPI